jgi:hypothetical protein
MSQVTTVSVTNSGWTRVDSLASHTYIEVSFPGEAATTQRAGLRIAGSDPGAGTAWNASGSRRMAAGEQWVMRLATTDQVWLRTETGADTVDVSEAL